MIRHSQIGSEVRDFAALSRSRILRGNSRRITPRYVALSSCVSNSTKLQPKPRTHQMQGRFTYPAPDSQVQVLFVDIGVCHLVVS
ncbi:MAG: hypothetical protein JWN39_3698 [Ilumatobacteraceae bacterium]|nr:hypothetical protein [Ilumatobacteraceae bacterium]